MRNLVAAAIMLTSITGCDLYWDDGGGDDDVVCHTPPAQEVRNPYTGLCEPNYGGGGGGCDSPCGPCDGGGAPEGAAQDWPLCYGSCSGLDEMTCGQTTGCHVAFQSSELTGFEPTFWGCWDVAPLPVSSAGNCEALDAYSCFTTESCTSYYVGDGYYWPTKFEYCGDESGSSTCANIDCGFGSHCEEQCYPCDSVDGTACPLYCSPMCVPDAPYTCATVDCGPGYTCVEQCDGGPEPVPGTMPDPATPPGYCYPTCVEIVNNPGTCYGDTWCDAIPPACPANTTPGILNGCYSGYCIPTSQCGPQNPGSCEPADGICLVGPPVCPIGTTPGTAGGCYTGYCIPDSQCPQLPCEALTDEAACQGRAECNAVYTGEDCTCTPAGCTCTSQTFARCETWWF